MPQYERSVTIRTTPERLFDFHTDTDNLPAISPPWFKTKLLTDFGAGKGRTIDFHVTSFGIRTTWQVTISDFERPYVLNDLVTRGPFKHFHHRRLFSPAEGSVTMTDHIDYDLPFGFLGKLADWLFVRRTIENMFSYRHKRTKELLEHAA